MKRFILLDLDAFFVSVERAENPELEGKPVVVCGNPKRKGVVASASYEVRPFGIRSGMPAGVAMRLCPQALYLPPRHSLYVEYSRRVLKIASQYTPHIEVVSIDEAFLEVSGCEMLFGSAEEIGRAIQRRIREEVHLPSSIGIASTRIAAKIACEQGKPNGFVSIPPGEEIAFLRPLPVSELWGVGGKMAEKLHRMGILTIGDLMDFPTHRLKEEFGIYGAQIQWLAQGKCDLFLPYLEGRKSIGLNHTLWENSADKTLLEKILYALCEEITAQMRREGIKGRRVSVTVRYGDYSTFSHQTTLKIPTQSARDVFEVARKLFYELWDEQREVRLLGVRVSLLSSLQSGGENLLFPEQEEDKKTRLNRAIDRIRRKYGERAIIPATLWRKKQRMEMGENEGEVENIHYPGNVRD
ncbi:MAG: DNA polymerase IV [bacterium JZ-2024 1]